MSGCSHTAVFDGRILQYQALFNTCLCDAWRRAMLTIVASNVYSYKMHHSYHVFEYYFIHHLTLPSALESKQYQVRAFQALVNSFPTWSQKPNPERLNS